MSQYTPMMQQYLDVKKNYQDALVFYRLGDFYELFFEDAKKASRELDLILTGRNAGVEEKVPMCGVPHHAVSGYIQRLVTKGYKVAIVEQLEDPATAVGIVKRDVIRVVTPGTIMEESTDEKSSIYIGSIYDYQYGYAVVLLEMATGETKGYYVERSFVEINRFLQTKGVRELVVDDEYLESKIGKQLNENPSLVLSICNNNEIGKEYQYLHEGIEDPRILDAFGRLLNYLETTQKRTADHLQVLSIANEGEVLYMDYATKQNLELTTSLKISTRTETLWSYMDHCQSSMGSRLLRKWIEYPLVNVEQINKRVAMIEYLNHNFLLKNELKESLAKTYDLDRLITKIAYGSANARDCLRLEQTLLQAPIILDVLRKSEVFTKYLKINACEDVLQMIRGVFENNPPLTIREGKMFVEGYDKQLDEFRQIQKNGKQWIAMLENSEREKTQIKNLRIGYNRVFGYYIEISKGNVANIKEEWNYVRKQTLTNAERFVTQELKEKEDAILHAEERAVRLEMELFIELVKRIKEYVLPLQKLAQVLAEADALYSLAVVSEQAGFVKPIFHEERIIEIVNGRHPIIEEIDKKSKYIPNNLYMSKNCNVQIITGPNMGGKSTFMRQVVITIIMAQIGCYVPAEKAVLPLFDKVFTRIGASDDILSGQSTFMVEMMEANHALQNATEKSFILFDEIGRGTSTYDGMALAQAMLEYIATCIGAKTLFSTHYHELTSLEDSNESIKNVHVEVHEEDDEVTFLYKVKEGRADRSYGINVARLAKLPDSVLTRAKQLLIELENNKDRKRLSQSQMVMIEKVPTELEKMKFEIDQIDPNKLTPMEALLLVADLKKLLNKKD